MEIRTFGSKCEDARAPLSCTVLESMHSKTEFKEKQACK